MVSLTFIYGSALLVVTLHFSEGQQEEKHKLVKRGGNNESGFMTLPDYESAWTDIASSAVSATSYKEFVHGLGEVPLLVDVQVKAIDGPNKGYIFQATGTQQRDDDMPEDFGGVIYIYSAQSVRVSAPITTNDNLGRTIYTGVSPYWAGPNAQDSWSAQVRVRCWRESSLPKPDFKSTGISIKSTTGSATDSYKKISHGINGTPNLVVSRIQFGLAGTIMYADSVGSAGVIFIGEKSYRVNGYVVFGYDSSNIQVWTPSDYYGRLLYLGDGFAIEAEAREAELQLFAWSSQTLPYNTSGTLKLSSTQKGSDKILDYKPAGNENQVFTRSWIQSATSPSSGYMFPGTGSLSYSTTANDKPCSYGGMVYAYTNQSVRYWQPIHANGAMVCIASCLGTTINNQAVNEGTAVLYSWGLDVNECRTNPCKNGATCENYFHSYGCKCAPGYTGTHCEYNMCSPYKIADIVFIIDVSVSQDGTTFDEQKNFTKDFIAQFPLGPDHFQFSIVVYASEPHAVFNLSNKYDNDTIIDAVDDATIPDDIRGATFTGKALTFVKDHSFLPTNGGRADVDRYVIILTDGMSSKSLDTLNQAKSLRLSYPNIRIKSIGSGKVVFHKELLDISAFPLNVFPLHGNDSVRSVQKSTMYGCERCTIAYSDVALAYDVSSFNYGQLDTLLKTAEVLISNLHTDVNQTRISLSKYESIAEEVFEFDKYRASYDMISVMNKHIQKRETCMKDVQCLRPDISSLLQDISNAFQKNSEMSRRKAVVIFSQFIFDKDIAERVFREIQNLKDNGVIVIVVGEGLEANIDGMLKLSTTRFFTFMIGEDLNTPIDAILALLSTLEYDICFV